MGNIQTAGPNEALVVSGGCCRPSKRSVIVGGWCWTTWMLTNIQRISLQVMTVEPKCENVQSRHGVPVTVSGVVHCKIMSAPEFLPLAAEQFLGKEEDWIKRVVKQIVEGHMRAVIGTQAIEDICKKRQELASMVREATTKDLSRMGIDIMSLTVQDIRDEVEYLDSAGKRAAAHVKRDADVEEARAQSEAAQVEANYKREIEEHELENRTKIEKQRHNNELAKASLSEDVNRIKAEASKAYDLQLACLEKGIKSIEMEVTAVEFDGKIKIQRKENERRKTELEMDVDLPTRADIYEMEKISEADIAKQRADMEAQEYQIQVEGKARAEATRIEGAAEADGMRLVAEARKEFNEAAVLFEVLKVLPEVAAEVASPLSKFEEIVLISEGRDKMNTNHTSIVNDSKPTKSMSVFAEAAKISSAMPLTIKAVGGSDSAGTNLLSSILQLQKSAS